MTAVDNQLRELECLITKDPENELNLLNYVRLKERLGESVTTFWKIRRRSDGKFLQNHSVVRISSYASAKSSAFFFSKTGHEFDNLNKLNAFLSKLGQKSDAVEVTADWEIVVYKTCQFQAIDLKDQMKEAAAQRLKAEKEKRLKELEALEKQIKDLDKKQEELALPQPAARIGATKKPGRRTKKTTKADRELRDALNSL